MLCGLEQCRVDVRVMLCSVRGTQAESLSSRSHAAHSAIADTHAHTHDTHAHTRHTRTHTHTHTQIVEAVLAAHESGELKTAISTGQDGFKVRGHTSTQCHVS